MPAGPAEPRPPAQAGLGRQLGYLPRAGRQRPLEVMLELGLGLDLEPDMVEACQLLPAISWISWCFAFELSKTSPGPLPVSRRPRTRSKKFRGFIDLRHAEGRVPDVHRHTVPLAGVGAQYTAHNSRESEDGATEESQRGSASQPLQGCE